ncbi:MAG: transcriptional regulator [Treponema sp.]|nr:transcriptional regulator [Treponema sp.]
MNAKHTLLEVFSENVVKFRMKRGITQEEMAYQIDLTPREITEIESGRHWTKPEKIEVICNLFEISYRELFDESVFTKKDEFFITDRKKTHRLKKEMRSSDSGKMLLKKIDRKKTFNKISLQKVLGENLIHLRHSIKMSQKELSAVSGVCEKSISNIENASAWPSASVLQRLSEGLRISYIELFETPIIVPNSDLSRYLYNLNHRELAILIEQLEQRRKILCDIERNHKMSV